MFASFQRNIILWFNKVYGPQERGQFFLFLTGIHYIRFLKIFRTIDSEQNKHFPLVLSTVLYVFGTKDNLSGFSIDLPLVLFLITGQK